MIVTKRKQVFIFFQLELKIVINKQLSTSEIHNNMFLLGTYIIHIFIYLLLNSTVMQQTFSIVVELTSNGSMK